MGLKSKTKRFHRKINSIKSIYLFLMLLLWWKKKRLGKWDYNSWTWNKDFNVRNIKLSMKRQKNFRLLWKNLYIKLELCIKFFLLVHVPTNSVDLIIFCSLFKNSHFLHLWSTICTLAKSYTLRKIKKYPRWRQHSSRTISAREAIIFTALSPLAVCKLSQEQVVS